MTKEIKLKVAEAFQDDVNKGIVRIDSSFMHQLGIRPGDIVELSGERKTVAISDRAYPGDIGLSIVRMDGITRRNSKTGIGEIITVKKAEIKEATKITITPAQKGIQIQAHPTIFKNGLLGRVLMKGDIVPLGGANKRRNTMGASFNDIFDMINENVPGFGFSDLKFIVAEVLPKQAVLITDQTEVIYDPEAKSISEEKVLEVTYEDIGGLTDEIKKIREMVELPLKHPEIFERLGIEPPKGVLLRGPPGTGKTLLAKAVANETASNFFLINGPEIMSKFYGQSEANLRKKFEDAEKGAPSIIFIDEIDAIAPKREENPGEVERRVVAQLLGVMDGLKSRGKVVVIAATNIPDSLDPALRRPGRFDREIEIGVPNQEGRLKILKIHTRNNPFFTKKDALKELNNIEEDYKDAIEMLLNNIENEDEFISSRIDKIISKFLKDNMDKNEFFIKIDNNILKDYIDKINNNPKVVNINKIAEKTHGFVGADLSALARESAMELLRRIFPNLKINENEPIPKSMLDKLKITMNDFDEALKTVRPSAMREVFVDIPNITWEDIGGLKEIKQELKEAIEWPLKTPHSFKRLGVKPPKGVLIYGPPGTGKTLLAKAVANESKSNFIPVKGPELLSKWVGESEKGVRKIFKRARQVSPAIIFFDEIDSLAPKRGSNNSDSNVTERVVNQILTEMDGLEEMDDVVLLAATNRPDIIDTALLRPGRFDRIILAPIPDEKTREKIFKIHTKKMPLNYENINEKESEGKNKKENFCKILASKTNGYVGADIEAVCREAAMLALREDINAKKITMKYFDLALKKIPPSGSEEIQKAYSEIKDQFSSARAKELKTEKPNYFG
ncbi:MAG: CDC48 family AAA ATPase [Nanoarchaeota archaeon]